jgi:hypothetical protein
MVVRGMNAKNAKMIFAPFASLRFNIQMRGLATDNLVTRMGGGAKS